MQNFNILKKSEIEETFRVKKIMSDFDLNIKNSEENFKGTINLDENWQIGLIVGASGTGKSTIAKELFNANLIKNFEYIKKSVIDDMPKCAVDEITSMFYNVGFGSVPSWLKPYQVLSNGEKMRVDLARSFLENDFIVFDEFTSVVDRNVAQTICIALNKYIKKTDKKFIAVGCHYDVIEYLQPNWIFDTNTMQFSFMKAHDHKKYMKSEVVGEKNGKSLANIII